MKKLLMASAVLITLAMPLFARPQGQLELPPIELPPADSSRTPEPTGSLALLTVLAIGKIARGLRPRKSA